jgi:hypothetical protein
MRIGRSAGVLGVALALSWPFGRQGIADDAATSYFCERFAGATWIDRIAAAPDGSIWVVGRTMSDRLPEAINPWTDGQNLGPFVSLVAAGGEVKWTRYLPFAWATCGDVVASADGGAWVAENVEDDHSVRVIKIGPDGAVAFEQTLDGVADEVATHLAPIADGDVVVVGTTSSPDFPVREAFQPQLNGAADGFVARVRGDGSGIAWSSYLGGPGFDDANAVAVDADGDLLVTTRRRVQALDVYMAVDARAATAIALARISGDGDLESTLALPADLSAGALDVVVAPDGRILVGGAAASRDGVLLAIDTATSSIGVVWREPGRVVDRVAVGPDGSVLMATDRYWSADYSHGSWNQSGGFIHLEANLSRALRRVDREEAWGVVDVAFARDGTLCVAGRGGATSARFNERIESPFGWFGDEPFVARLPSSGAAAPSKTRLTRRSRTSAALSWDRHGDAVVAFEVEERVGSVDSVIRPDFQLIDRLDPSRRGALLEHLPIGRPHHLRLVSVFPNGVRSAVAAPTPAPAPLVVRRVRARIARDDGLLVTWNLAPFRDGTIFDVERSVEDGPFAAPPGFEGAALGSVRPRRASGRFVDADPSISGKWVTYRVRATPVSPREQPRWTYTLPVRAR